MFTSSYKLTISEYIDDGLSLWSKTTISMLPEGLALILSSRIPVCKQKYEKSYFLLTGRSWAQYMIPRVYKSEYDVSPACPAWLEQLSTLLELQISSFQNQLFIVNKSDLAQNRPNNIENFIV